MSRVVAALLTSILLAIGCGHSAGSAVADAAAGDDASTGDDASADAGASGDSSADAAPDSNALDGTPMRRQCTGTFGSALSQTFGRLDGYLVAIVPPGTRGCNGDSSHVHLQVLVNNAVYDVAVNVDGMFHQQDLAPPGAPWSEGWHTGVNDSYAMLGVHSTMFMQSTPAQLAPVVEQALASANHVSVWATGYGPTGAHLVHYQGRRNDGMVVINPLSPTAHALMFAFHGDTF